MLAVSLYWGILICCVGVALYSSYTPEEKRPSWFPIVQWFTFAILVVYMVMLAIIIYDPPLAFRIWFYLIYSPQAFS